MKQYNVKPFILLIGKNNSLINDVNDKISEYLKYDCIQHHTNDDNLHPLELHKQILKYVKKYNQGKKIIISTNNPYVFSTLNICLIAYNIGSLNHKKEISKIIDRKYWLNVKDLFAIEIDKKNNLNDLIDKENNLLVVDSIDSISVKIADKFDSILKYMD